MIKIIDGDITHVVNDPNVFKLICHVVNDQGIMGSGVARALFTKWPLVRDEYLRWFRLSEHNNYYEGASFGHGIIQELVVEPQMYVINMVAMRGVGRANKPFHYEDFENCLRSVREMSEGFDSPVEIHMPYLIGCGLAGGNWEKTYHIIEDVLADKHVTLWKFE